MFNFLLIIFFTTWMGQVPLPALPAFAGLASAIRAPDIPRRVTASVGVVTTARAAIVVDAKTGASLYEKNTDEPLPLASLTKLMTALVVLDANPKWDERVKMVSDDFVLGGTDRLHPGDELTVRELFGLSLVASENNATRALMRATTPGCLPDPEPVEGEGSRCLDNFVSRMNEKARTLGLRTAQFTEPTGLHETNRASAKNVAWLARAAFAREEIRSQVSRSEARFVVGGKARYAPSTDDLLKTFLNQNPYTITAGKTGSLNSHQYNLALQIAHTDGGEAIVVVLGSATDESRFQDAKGLTVWVLKNYLWK